jgi:hypothetical protein
MLKVHRGSEFSTTIDPGVILGNNGTAGRIITTRTTGCGQGLWRWVKPCKGGCLGIPRPGGQSAAMPFRPAEAGSPPVVPRFVSAPFG